MCCCDPSGGYSIPRAICLNFLCPFFHCLNISKDTGGGRGGTSYWSNFRRDFRRVAVHAAYSALLVSARAREIAGEIRKFARYPMNSNRPWFRGSAASARIITRVNQYFWYRPEKIRIIIVILIAFSAVSKLRRDDTPYCTFLQLIKNSVWIY